MKLLVAVETHFYETPNGEIWTQAQNDYAFWERYLHVFGQVLVLARVEKVELARENWLKASGERVAFWGLPNYTGPWEYLTNRSKIKAEVRKAVSTCDYAILRVAGAVATAAWKELMRKSIPYAVEVCGDPWESLKPGTVRSVTRPIARIVLSNDLKKQCAAALAASYVTERTLQQRYPASNGIYSMGISDVSLPEDAFRDRVIELRSDSPIALINVGSMETLYKAQDVQIKAVKECRDRGLNIVLHLVGDGRCRRQFESLAQELGIQEVVKFHGSVAGFKAVSERLDGADIFILPSLVEGLPRALVEAMARGMPCIATRVGGIPELLPSIDLVEPNDPISLANKIIEVCTDITRLNLMSATNYKRAQNFSSDILQQKRVEFYNHLKLQAKT